MQSLDLITSGELGHDDCDVGPAYEALSFYIIGEVTTTPRPPAQPTLCCDYYNGADYGGKGNEKGLVG